jgi:zinc protease
MIKQLFTLLFFSVVSISLFAQEQIQISPKAAVPMDPQIRYGQLENGLTYYIKANKTPEKRAEFYLINNVGSMQETPMQNGLAHLTEHMCFNGTKNFEKKDIIHYLESIGMKFGPEINAYTIYDETVYTLNKVPIETKENIDTSLMILFDWASNVSMETSEINSERGVVHEEFRTRRSAMMRMRDEINSVLFAGSKYAVHNVIGTEKVITDSPCDTLRAYYTDWYRPDLQAIIVVGDIDVDQLENKVKTMFSKLPAKKDARERKYYQIPNHKDVKVVIAKDKESPYTIVQAIYKKDKSPYHNQNEYREEHIGGLISIMLNARLSEKTLAADPPFMQAYAFYSDLVRTKDAYMSMAVTSNEKITRSLEEILTENERFKKYGFLESELERAKKELVSMNEKAYKERHKKENEEIANALKDNFLTKQPVPSPDWDYAFTKQILSEITLDEVNEFGKYWVTDENLVIAIMAPDKDGVILPTETEILAINQKVKQKEITQYVDAAANKPLIDKTPIAGTIISEEKEPSLGVTNWTLSNGVKVVIKQTDFKDDEILMTAYSKGGSSKVAQKDDVSAKMACEVIEMSGLGSFDNISLQKALAGKNVRVSPYIGELSEGFNGNSAVSDFSTMLQLTYLYFTAPRADKDAFENYKERTAASLSNKSADPQSAFIDSLRNAMSQNHPRKRNMTVEMLKEANLGRIKYIFTERFGDPSGFTFYLVGNIDPGLQKDTILKYLGGLPTVKRDENWSDLGVRMPAKRVEKHFTRSMETDKSTVFIAFTGTIKKYTIEDRLMLEMVEEYLNNRYLETLREDQGGTYGASLWSDISHFPVAEYQLGVFFDANPNKLDTMLSIVYDEADKLIANGADEKVIRNTAENKIKEYNENLRENSWWMSVLKNDDFNQEEFVNFDYVAFWNSLNSKKVQAAAKKFLDQNRTIEVVQSTAK